MGSLKTGLRLFIGGPADGERREIDKASWYMPRPMPPGLEPLNKTKPVCCDGEAVRYDVMRLTGETEMFIVMVAEGLNGDAVMRMLVDGYRRATE